MGVFNLITILWHASMNLNFNCLAFCFSCNPFSDPINILFVLILWFPGGKVPGGWAHFTSWLLSPHEFLITTTAPFLVWIGRWESGMVCFFTSSTFVCLQGFFFPAKCLWSSWCAVPLFTLNWTPWLKKFWSSDKEFSDMSLPVHVQRRGDFHDQWQKDAMVDIHIKIIHYVCKQKTCLGLKRKCLKQAKGNPPDYPIEKVYMDELHRLLKCCEISPKFSHGGHFILRTYSVEVLKGLEFSI